MTKYIILGHENPDLDSLVSGYLLEKLLTSQGKQAEFIIPDQIISNENLSLCESINLDPKKYQKPLPKEDHSYILVDHHEREVPGHIEVIIDHHPTEKNITCPIYYNVPSSSTSLLIVKDNEDCFSKEDIKAAIFAAMVDTVAFHSAKAVSSDITWCQEQCQKYGFNYNDLLTQSMCETDISDLNQAALNGLKRHNLSNHPIATSFLHLPHPEEDQDKIDAMIDILKNYRKDNNYTMFAFLVHDITNFTSTVYKIYNNHIDKTTYDEYASRGTIVIPELTKELKTYQKKKDI